MACADGGLREAVGAMRSLVLCLAVSCAALAAHGTRMRPLTVEELALQADAVVHGRVRKIETRRDPERRIHTRVELDVFDVWKGSGTGEPWTVVVGGGVLGEERVAAEGQATFSPGEEVVLYLVRNPAGEWVVVGMAQGKFRVLGEAGDRRVTHIFWGAPEEGPRAGRTAAPWRRPLTLVELRRRTREAAQ